MSKKYYQRDTRASTNDKDTFGTIYESMLLSDTWQSLKKSTQNLYIYCRVQSRSRAGRACLFKHAREYETKYDSDIEFVFPAKHIEKYGLDRRNFKRGLTELIQAGFLEIVEQNNHRRDVNVYRFSNKWSKKS